MLRATLVTLATFLIEISNCSPVYNMQPAFVTTHIGSFSGRNIRNLPCISRKNPSQTGVCMFAIDCLKSNGTHLGTCIDRFYFGSCCHIEPHVSENTIDTEVIDIREPPVRLHNTTSSLLSTTSTSKIPLSSSTNLSSSTKKPLIDTKKPTTTTHKESLSTSKNPSSTNPQIMGSITKKPSRITTKSPPVSSSTSRISTQNVLVKLNTTASQPVVTTLTTTSTESSTAPEKLQTFQLIDGTLIETTTSKSSFSTNNKKTVPTKPSTKATSPITTLKPASTTNSTKPTKSTVKPASKPPTSQKITTKPVKTSKPTISTKVTSKPTKPAKVTSSTSTLRPTTISTGTTTRKPTKKATKPSSTSGDVQSLSTEKTTTATSKTVASTKVSTTRKPDISSSTTGSKKPTITKRPPTSPLTSPVTSQSTDKTTKPPSALTTTLLTKLPAVSETTLSKFNVTEVQETVVGNVDTNEIIESAASTTTTHKTPALVTWTFNDNKTTILGGNSGVVLTNITEEWVPLNPQDSTPQDEWVLLPTATHQIPTKNETLSTANPLPSISVTTQIPSVDIIVSEGSSVAENVSEAVSSSTSFSERPVLFTDISSEPPVNDTSFVWFTTTSSQEPLITVSANASSTASTSISPFVSVENTTISSNLSSIANVSMASQVTESISLSFTEALPSSTTAIATEESEIKPVNMSDFTDVCGRRMYPGARIVGGENSAYGRWPWQISLRQWRTSTYLHKCGAALLNENWAITAAHCVDNVPPNDLLLRLGEYDLSTDSEPYLHQERRVQIVASHPQFDPSTFEYDLALLRFYEPVTFQPNILPVCVPRDDENFVGKTAYVTGWGRLYEDGPLPSILQEVSVPVINNSVCETMYRSAGYIEHIPNIFICAGWRRGGFDSCEGDSGGPMVIQRQDKRFQLAGIISWGIGCAEPNQPGVYTRISEFRDWINQILQF